jgi:DNA-binding transcriptional ArsR family regulator
MDTHQALEALDALGQPSRLAIFRLLVQAGQPGRAVGDIRAALGLPAATLSNHLNVLRQAGLVLDRRDGRSIVCRADYARMNALVGYLTENCCAGADCGVPGRARPTPAPC